MPPKARITREDITATALALVREKGEGAINARAIANALQCSTQPVFSNFANMESLRESVIKSAYNEYLGFIENEIKSGKYPRYKSFGMAYIRFAREEKELFRLLFMRDRSGEDTSALS
ncbi:MAG: WHG domain-containing protein, partial [Clostridia bacterium]|nr:WHG domain-containing protein [Clostridia bacterium]